MVMAIRVAEMTEDRSATIAEQRALVTPLFRLVFITVTVLTLLLFFVYAGLALLLGHPDPQQSTLMDFCSGTSAFGFGGIFGLMGGKAMDL